MIETRRLQVDGQVQGVGFRPFVYRLACELGLNGEVANSSSSVLIHLQGEAETLDRFHDRLREESPGQAESVRVQKVSQCNYSGFTIAASCTDTGAAVALLADRAICGKCLQEFDEPTNRRFQYPFISCTNCGPRFSISKRLPFDREHTSWHEFPACAACAREFRDPENRRFHTVSISCPQCGPTLSGPDSSRDTVALDGIATALKAGGIVAVKGVSGFHLLADANNAEAVAKLANRKQRRKPFAVMAPDLAWVRNHAELSATEAAMLQSPTAPIVLLQSNAAVASRVAPGTGLLGVMLPSSGIHLALMRRLQRPMVATSGNNSCSPLIFDNQEALASLQGIADAFLLHDLPLVQGLDDSVLRFMDSHAVPLRLGRGLAPQVHTLPVAASSLGCGAEIKASIAAQDRHTLIVGPHIGDLDAAATRRHYRRQKKLLPTFFQLGKGAELTDMHPDYASTIEADYRARTIPHHIAHAMAAWLEHQVAPPFTVLTWDGVGLGPDGSIWGGECFEFDANFHWRRLGSVRPFQLPVRADIARFPGRIAHSLRGRPIQGNSVTCSSMGRLIEGLAALAGLRQHNQYEAQAAMEWEALAWEAGEPVAMDFELDGFDLDWRPLLAIVSDDQLDPSARALGFHQALARAALRQCALAASDTLLISGGVFQNRLLVETMLEQARPRGVRLLVSERLPPNDGGIAAGQCVAAAMAVSEKRRVEECA